MPNPHINPWTQEEDDILREHWLTRSAKAVGEMMEPPRSKNSIISRARRLNLKRKPSPIATVPAEPCHLADIKPRRCLYPVSQSAPYLFCNKRTTPPSPYCKEHKPVCTRKLKIDPRGTAS